MRFDTLRASLQPRAAASGGRHDHACESLLTVTAALSGLEELGYPFHGWTAVVTRYGRMCYQRRKINLSDVAGQKVGVKTADHIWRSASSRAT
jgi:hypothetical protein